MESILRMAENAMGGGGMQQSNIQGHPQEGWHSPTHQAHFPDVAYRSCRGAWHDGNQVVVCFLCQVCTQNMYSDVSQVVLTGATWGPWCLGYR